MGLKTAQPKFYYSFSLDQAVPSNSGSSGFATATRASYRSTPTATPSAVAVAQTGGFDFRLPLIGLTVIVAGLALYLVSASRGRPSTGR